MSESAIVVENLSKRYLIGHRYSNRGPYKYLSLRDAVAREVRNFGRKAFDVVRGEQVVQGDAVEEFWALRDVTFEVRRGEAFGIIGRNGAGKSTLLKILSRITEPTRGKVSLRGRVSSLLEVGTGFHPELTGRENVFLNGAILGMTQREIRRRFDEIVAFAEVERFLDTPVKHYSSGMYVRLAFAVAAHLEPEILIIDEVLAVGDASFQAKCLDKMRNVATEGRTILFVSHNMSALLQLTKRVVLLSQGGIEYLGAPADAVEKYLRGGAVKRTTQYDVRDARRRYGTGDVKILSLGFDRSAPYFNFLEPIRYSVTVKAKRSVDRLRVGMTVFSIDGAPVGSCFSAEVPNLTVGEERDLLVELAPVRLAPGHYFCGVSVGCGDHRTLSIDYDVVMDVLNFEVGPERLSSGSLASWSSANWGSICFPDLTIESTGRRSS
jgi:lipopolysaccharide transport system ATP-binding protein